MDYYAFRELRMSLPIEIGTEKFRSIMREMLALLDDDEVLEFYRLNSEEGRSVRESFMMMEIAADKS